jgi:hypothetical protein
MYNGINEDKPSSENDNLTSIFESSGAKYLYMSSAKKIVPIIENN